MENKTIREGEEKRGKNKKRIANEQLRKEEDNDNIKEIDDETWKRGDESILSKRKFVRAQRNLSSDKTKPNISFPSILTSTDSKEKNLEENKKKIEDSENKENLKEKNLEENKKKIEDNENKEKNLNEKDKENLVEEKHNKNLEIKENIEQKDKKETKPLFNFSFTSSNFTFNSTPFVNFNSSIQQDNKSNVPSIFGFNIQPPLSSKNETDETTEEFNVPISPKPIIQLPLVEVKTGEEGEENLFQAQAKLFSYNKKDVKWFERGYGLVRINKMENGNIRLLMRTKASFRLILNSLLWSSMHTEKLNDKSIRFIATDFETNQLDVYLIKFEKIEEADEFLKIVEENKNKYSQSSNNHHNTTNVENK